MRKIYVLIVLMFTLAVASCSNLVVERSNEPSYVGSSKFKATGFVEYDENGNYRDTGHNLSSGDLSGRVQFVQTHAMEPNGNSENYFPTIITERDALFLFMPTDNITDNITSIKADIYLDGTLKKSVYLDKPSDIPMADSPLSLQNDIQYSRKAWTNVIEWNLMKKGLSVKLRATTDNDSTYNGELVSSDIQFGPASEGIFHFIQLGMLTEPVTYASDPEHYGYMIFNPARAMSDYFQTVPFARVVNAQYERVTLRRVMNYQGVVYDMDSPDINDRYSKSESGVYAGDMRGSVGKSQVSVGINLANSGYPSWDLSEGYGKTKKQFLFTSHNNQGRYINYETVGGVKKPVTVPTGNDWNLEDYTSVVRHGLSGGNGIGTLMDSVRNEFSHEVGHGYGQGHYMRPPDSPEYYTGQHANSGWAYDAYHNMMKGSFNWYSNANSDNMTAYFQGKYDYLSDTMSSGEGNGTISKYTTLTPYTAWFTQNNLGGYPVLVGKSGSSTSYVKWNYELEEYEDYVFDNDYEAIYGVPNDEAYVPYKIGVPVVTILGSYLSEDDSRDPYDRAILHPGFVSNYGNVYNLPAPDKSKKSIWVEVTFENGSKKEIAVRATKHINGSVANQVNINIEAALKPISATLYIQEVGGTKQLLGKTIELDYQRALDMPEPIIIGKEHGYTQALDQDVEFLNTELLNHESELMPILTQANAFIIHRLIEHDRLKDLNANAKAVADRYINVVYGTKEIKVFIDSNKEVIESKDELAVKELKRLLEKYDFIASGEVPKMPDNSSYTTIRSRGNIYFDAEALNIVGSSETVSMDNATPSMLWVMDKLGRIRPKSDLSLCLEPKTGNVITPVACNYSTTVNNQNFRYEATADGAYQLIRHKTDGWVFDYGWSNRTFTRYGYHGGSNQHFVIENTQTYDNILFTVMPYEYLEIIYKSFE